MTNLRMIDVEDLLTGLLADNTVAAYATHWGRYLDFAGHFGDPKDAETLAAWRKHMIQETQESASTINLRLSAVKSVFRELAQRKLVAKEVAWAINDVKGLKPNTMPKRRRRNARVRIEPEQMRDLINIPNIQLGDPVGARNRALLMLLATSGLRVSEAIKVRVEDIQRRGQNYFIGNIIGKGQSEPAVAPLSAEAYAAIQDWLYVRPTHSEWVFTSVQFTDQEGLLFSEQSLTRSAARHIVKKVGAEYGMPEIKPHDFRRFVGTQLAKTDIRQAQRVLRHANLNTTAKHYVMDDVPLGSTEGLF